MRNDRDFGPWRPGPLWQPADDADDPSLIILRTPQSTQNAPSRQSVPSMPDDPRHRALLRAGFRSHAENLLLASMGRLPEGEPPDNNLVSQALDDARRTFGAVDGAIEGETRGALDGMMTVLRAGALRRAETLLHERALDALEAEADDLVAQVRRDPDRIEAYGRLLEQATERFAAGLEAADIGAFRANLDREMRQAQVLGLRDQERFDHARAALASAAPSLPDGQSTWLESAIASEERRVDSNRQAQRALVVASAAQQIDAQGGMSPALAEDVRQLPAPDQRRLAQLAGETAARDRRNDERIAAAGDAAAGQGWPADMPESQRVLAAELYWQRAAAANLAFLPVERRVPLVATQVANLGTVPVALRRRIVVGLTEAVAPQQRLESARQLIAILRSSPELEAVFRADQVRFADAVTQAFESGFFASDPARSLLWADRHAPLDPPLPPPADNPTDKDVEQPSGHGPFGRVRMALAGGPPLDPDSLADRLLAEAFWQDSLQTVWEHESPGESARRITDFVTATHVLPESLLADIKAGLAGSDPMAAARAAFGIARLGAEMPEHLGAFSALELERANLMAQAIDAGRSAIDALALADERHPAEEPVRGPMHAGYLAQVVEALVSTGLMRLTPRPSTVGYSGALMRAPGSGGNLDGYFTDLYVWSPVAAERLMMRIAANPEVSDPRSPDGSIERQAEQNKVLGKSQVTAGFP